MNKKPELDLVVSKVALIDKIMHGRLDAWLVLLREFHGNFEKDHTKNQLEVIRKFERLLDNPKQTTEIRIIKGSIEYTFFRDEDISVMYSLFEVIDRHIEQRIEYRKRRGMSIAEDYLQTIKEEEHHTDMVKQLFNHSEVKRVLPTERQRYLLIWELYRRAGYPFNKQQLEASDQNKASLIRNWFKRNKNQKIRS